MSKEKHTKQTQHFFIKTKKGRIAGQSIAEILKDGERYRGVHNASRKRHSSVELDHCEQIAQAPQTDTADEDRYRSDII
jgi:hypothetical protein